MEDMVQVRRDGKQRHEGPEARIGRSQFNRSHGLKMTFDASRLYPILVDEVLPGDTFTCRLNGFARIFSPLDAPVMDNIELETFFFFCPARLLWDNWQYFQGEHDAAGAQDVSFTVPVLATGWTVDHAAGVTNGHGLAAYMGLPHAMTSAGVTSVNALPFRMYNRVFNEWFKDQNVGADSSFPMNVGNGPDSVADHSIAWSNKRHDYFTSSLPYLQKGTSAPVSLAGKVNLQTLAAAGENVSLLTGMGTDFQLLDSGAAQVDISVSTDADGSEKLFVDLADTGSIDINALRQSVAIQRLLERDARGGTRYVETIKSHFGVTSPDFRLQRPEYLGGGKSMLHISPVANTSGVDSTVSISGNDEPQGELRGVGTGVIQGHGWAKSFTEHGYILGLIRARGDLTYFQGLDKLWSRSTRYDFYIPALAHLGEQSVLNKELWVSNVTATDDAVFGYQERWAEYRMKMSRVIGVFNPDVSGSLSHWHLAEDFATLPALNVTFIQDKTPLSRITTVDSQPDFLLDVWFDYKCARPLPVFSVPSIAASF